MCEAADVRSGESESVRKFARHGEVHHFGIRSLQLVVEAERDLLHWIVGRADRRRVGERRRRRGIQKQALRAARRNVVQAGEACASVNRLNGGRVGNDGRKSECAILIVRVEESFAEVVVYDAEACPDGRLARAAKERAEQTVRSTGRVGERKTRPQVFVIIRPERRFTVALAAGRIRNDLRIPKALVHGHGPAVDVLIQAGGRLHLISAGFIGRFKNGVAEPCGDRQIRSDMPGILCIPVELPRAERFRYKLALWNLNVFGGAVVLAGDFGNDADEIDDGIVIDLGIVWVYSRETERARIKAAAATRRGCGEEHGICTREIEISDVAFADVVDVANIRPELQCVLAVRPGDIVHPVVHRDMEFGGSGGLG